MFLMNMIMAHKEDDHDDHAKKEDDHDDHDHDKKKRRS